jgi:hypothetical protein
LDATPAADKVHPRLDGRLNDQQVFHHRMVGASHGQPLASYAMTGLKSRAENTAHWLE